MAPAKKTSAKKASAARAPAKKAAAAAKEPAEAAVTRAATGKAAAKTAPAKTAPAKTTPAKTAPTAKAPVRTAAPAKAPAPKSVPRAAKKAVAKKAAPAKAAPAKKAVAKKPPFDAKFLDEQKGLLLTERATYTRQADNLQAEADSLAELREPGDVQFDEESGEGDTLAVERERDLALSARAREQVEEIDRALAKLVAGTYGICEVSGEPIPRARLQAIPQAREKVEFKVGGFNRR